MSSLTRSFGLVWMNFAMRAEGFSSVPLDANFLPGCENDQNRTHCAIC